VGLIEPNDVINASDRERPREMLVAQKILLNEHIAEDGATVFAHACQLGAEGIVSKRIDSTYQSGPCRVWIKVRSPASIAVQRGRSESWKG
jgi:ATP-dependent DNA ligase